MNVIVSCYYEVMKAHYLIGKTKLPDDIDEGTRKILKELEGITDQKQYLRKAYDKVTSSYKGGRINTFSRVWELFSSGIDDLINRTGFMHCTNQNYVLTNILIKSGLFDDSDINLKWTNIWVCTPHQYLEIKVGKSKTYVDCWARHYGIPFGSFARRFNTSFTKSFAE